MKKCYMLFIVIGLILNPITFIATKTNQEGIEENNLNPIVDEKNQRTKNAEYPVNLTTKTNQEGIEENNLNPIVDEKNQRTKNAEYPVNLTTKTNQEVKDIKKNSLSPDEKNQWTKKAENTIHILGKGITQVGRPAIKAIGSLTSATGYAAYGVGKGLEYTGAAFHEIAKSDTLVLTICSAALLFGTYKICTTAYNDTGLKKLLDTPINILRWFKGRIDYILGDQQPPLPPYNPPYNPHYHQN